jgi:hypothetical protein
VDQTVEDLITLVECQKLRIDYLEEALLNLTGFRRSTEDGSRQGKIIFELAPSTVPATPKDNA